MLALGTAVGVRRGAGLLGRTGASQLRPLATAAAGMRTWRVYLSGEIHTDWREQLAAGVHARQLPIELTAPNPSHADSDDCAAIILGMEERRPNWDAIGARMNAIRTRTLLAEADVVVVRFGDKYRQVCRSVPGARARPPPARASSAIAPRPADAPAPRAPAPRAPTLSGTPRTRPGSQARLASR